MKIVIEDLVIIHNETFTSAYLSRCKKGFLNRLFNKREFLLLFTSDNLTYILDCLRAVFSKLNIRPDLEEKINTYKNYKKEYLKLVQQMNDLEDILFQKSKELELIKDRDIYDIIELSLKKDKRTFYDLKKLVEKSKYHLKCLTMFKYS